LRLEIPGQRLKKFYSRWTYLAPNIGKYILNCFMAIRIIGFLDFVHRPDFYTTENSTLRNLDPFRLGLLERFLAQISISYLHSVHVSPQFLTAYFLVTSLRLSLVSGVCIAALM
jgi:hypothetical protein